MADHLVLIAAVTKNNGIGLNNELLFKLSADMKRFRELTYGSTVIMGRKTWESLPPKFRPLPMRTNIVLSRNENYEAPGAQVFTNLDQALRSVITTNVFVIGGEQIFAEAMPYATVLELTEIDKDAQADAFFPVFDKEVFKPIHSSKPQNEDGIVYRFVTYIRKKTE